MPPAGGLRASLSYQVQGGPMSGRFVSAWSDFSPGTPIMPAVAEPVRVWDFPVGINTVIRPRAYQPFGFPELRAFSNVELVRLAIETRKDQVERLDWRIKPKNGVWIGDASAWAGGADPRIEALEGFWRRPDGVTPFATWLRLALEDLLVLDAPAFERRRSRGGALIGLDVIPGDTIHPMVDETGRRPRGPGEIAFQQVIKG
jgi:hypothetical protein